MALSNDFAKEICVFDTTLRDGEQTPGVSLTPEKKLLVAKQLDELGVNVIEAGFAAASEGEMEAIKLIAKENMRAEVCSFARGVKKDIDAVIKSGADSVFLVIPSSDMHIRYKLKKSKKEILELTEETVQYAKDHGLTVELGPEDSTRADLKFLKQMIAVSISSGADRVTPCDTVGVLTPEKTYMFYRDLKKEFPDVPLGVHSHDDFGMAVANSVAALRAGAEEVHVTVNGLGERAGNASLEEVVVSLKLLYNVDTNIKTEKLYDTSLLVSRVTGITVQPNKAIVGENAFVHESGIHTHAILSEPLTYEPIPPEIVGRTRRLAVGKHAGSKGIEAALREMGLTPTDKQLNEIFMRVKSLGDKGKRVTDADLKALAESVMGLPSFRAINLEELTVVTGNRVTPTASVRLNLNGKLLTQAATGIGPVDAAMRAIRRAVSAVEPIRLEEYHVNAITGGTNALVEVLVRLRKGDRVATAMGAHGDIVMASVEAMLNGMNVLMSNNHNKSGNKSFLDK
ncbi:2-isopropylmalate synthase [Candidatus Bathyarchaeota archaeon ex4484_231]|nr:MAG: 2-isopropylmalate synthase [Candidatus Bathyarchaeota archaeon ex4484_231]RJS75752.1 MAG: 2-isopropylmalate synthase [Candidatus Bathyarchaeota archaeon]